jgi:hypothetical protein
MEAVWKPETFDTGLAGTRKSAADEDREGRLVAGSRAVT